MAAVPPPKRLVIVGANFAGLKAALKLPPYLAVTVFDPLPDFEYRPQIHELLSGITKPDQLTFPRKRAIERAGHGFIQKQVTHINGPAGLAVTSDGNEYPFDACLVSVGGTNHTGGVRGARRFSLPFNSVAQCHTIGQKLKSLFHQEAAPCIVIVGGGLEGIEALGEILRRYRKYPGYRLCLIESGPHLFRQAFPKLEQDIQQRCLPYPVDFFTRTRVEWIQNRTVGLSSGETIDADCVIWTAGSQPSPLLWHSRLSLKEGQLAPVNPYLQSERHPNVFVAGDAADIATASNKQAYHALQMGTAAARNLRRHVQSKPLLKFRPPRKPLLVCFGDLQSYAILGQRVLAGPSLALAKQAAFHRTMADLNGSAFPVSLYRSGVRYASSFSRLFFPSILSFKNLMRLPNVRLL